MYIPFIFKHRDTETRRKSVNYSFNTILQHGCEKIYEKACLDNCKSKIRHDLSFMDWHELFNAFQFNKYFSFNHKVKFISRFKLYFFICQRQ